MSQRKKYSAEFKTEAVELVRSSASSAGQIARDIGVGGRRCSIAGVEKPQIVANQRSIQGTGTPRDQELVALKRELAKVKKERNFLRGAAALFAKESS